MLTLSSGVGGPALPPCLFCKRARLREKGSRELVGQPSLQTKLGIFGLVPSCKCPSWGLSSRAWEKG